MVSSHTKPPAPTAQTRVSPADASLETFCRDKLNALDAKALKRTLVTTNRGAAATAARAVTDTGTAASYLSFCCNDYLNLSQHPAVKAAAIDATQRYGAGAGASRLVTGNYDLYDELEQRLARIKGTEAAVVFGSGYLANLGIIPTLAGPDDLVLVDELAHACLFAGAQLTRAPIHVFRHNDTDHLRTLLSEHRSRARHTLILTDGIFSMDGDVAPLDGLTALAQAFDAWLMTDDAHGIGVVGGGRGSTFTKNTDDITQEGDKFDIPLQMGTLSKAVGSYGGYLCASQNVVDLIKTRARSLIYTTGLPPAAVAASNTALQIIESDRDLCARPIAKTTLFARQLGLNIDPQSPILPVILGGPERTLNASKHLEAEGFLVTAIRPPTVPDGTARLRITFTAEHNDDDIMRLAKLIREDILNGAPAQIQ